MKRRLLTIPLLALALASVALPAAAHADTGGDPRSPDVPRERAPVGEVRSFADGKLTIALTNGETVSGAVGPRTAVFCLGPRRGLPSPPVAPQQPSTTSRSRDGDRGHQPLDERRPGEGRGGRWCGREALVAGAPVLGAHVALSGEGLVFGVVTLKRAA